jgi:hypothetical protein
LRYAKAVRYECGHRHTLEKRALAVESVQPGVKPDDESRRSGDCRIQIKSALRAI